MKNKFIRKHFLNKEKKMVDNKNISGLQWKINKLTTAI